MGTCRINMRQDKHRGFNWGETAAVVLSRRICFDQRPHPVIKHFELAAGVAEIDRCGKDGNVRGIQIIKDCGDIIPEDAPIGAGVASFTTLASPVLHGVEVIIRDRGPHMGGGFRKGLSDQGAVPFFLALPMMLIIFKGITCRCKEFVGKMAHFDYP